ncbi:MAG TPA: aldehyde dehydrogenase family protein [Solirubrobacteraceae bacterium]|nr:aldehyde dehydrogenase family protein [Solirubrobacteraceae bacterium]
MAATTSDDVRPITIDGEQRLARSGETISAVNPATGEAIARFPRGTAEDVADAVAAAKRAQPAWRDSGPLARAAAVRKLADVIEEHAEELALLDVRDNGSPIREMRRDAFTAANQLRYFAGLALELRGETIPSTPERLNYTLLQPFGVVGRIIPFNHPFMFAGGKIAAPLIAGNTTVIKPSEHTSLSAIRLGELATGVLPDGVLNVVTGVGQEAGDALVTHTDVRRLAFIGSAEIGRSIQQRAATEVVKTVTLELGGKNPIAIFPDADLELAIDGALRGMNFTWQGQSCGSTSRLLVHESIRAEFVERLAARMEALKSGMPDDEATDTGAIVHRRQYEKVVSYLEIGRSEGARVVVGGGPVADAELQNGMFIRPTLFENVSPSSRLAQEEIFGPVLAVIPFATYDEAVAISNGVSYGLTASVFTGDLGVAHRFASDVEAGYVWVNDASTHFPGAPYGGFKDSGVGREESFDELASYAQIKNVNVRYSQS